MAFAPDAETRVARLNIPNYDPSDDIAPIAFANSDLLTLGVEIEIQLINPKTLGLTGRACELLRASHKSE